MDDARIPQTLVGVGVLQSYWYVHVLPENRSFRIAVDEAAGGRLLAELGFAKALRKLAKTDSIDAQTLALFPERVQPQPFQKTPEKQVQLDALVTRRRQLLALRGVERTSQQQTAQRTARQSIDKTVKFFDGQIAALDKAIARLIDADDE